MILRCNIAIILLTDLIVDHGVKVEWSAYIHLLLHAIFIGNVLLRFNKPHKVCQRYGPPQCYSVFLFWLSLDCECVIYHMESLHCVRVFSKLFNPDLTNRTSNSPGFDHQHPEVYEHCKRLLLHLLIVQGANSNVQSVAMVLLRNRDFNEPRVLTVKPVAPDLNLTGQSRKNGSNVTPGCVL